ncbi:MAG: SDR family NAD(P)-dependent oxidoreductase [Vicinamibacteria bacterium]|nr:SDR family NAD(P)-dependent oxidoreductase [Vicinamibacteria bacterium]
MNSPGCVVAVTGASSGIGFAAARAFSREGAQLAVAARRRDRLDALVKEIEVSRGKALAVEADVSVEADVHRFVDETVTMYGRIDVMINNAGLGIRGRVEETPPADFERLMKTNFMGTVYGCQAALKHMRVRNEGVILNVSSIVGHRALPGGSAYGASKAAQISLTEALRVELQGTGILVMSVHPIATQTEFSAVALKESGGRTGAPVGPVQTAEQVAEAMVRAVRRPRPEVHPYPMARGLVALNAIFPSLVDRWAGRARKS